MRISERYGGQYLKAGLVDKPMLLTVKKVTEEAMRGDPRDIKLVAYFEETDKRLALNSTNANNLASSFGDDAKTWKGRQLVVYPTTCDFQGKTVDCLRVRQPKPKGQASPAPVSTSDDDVPF